MSTTQQRTAPASTWDFEQVYASYRKPILSYLLSVLGSLEQAEDCTQETFLKAFRALATTEGPLNMSAWLYRIAHNVATDVLRRRKLIHWQSLEAQEFETVEFAGSDEEEPEARYTGTTAAVRVALTRIEAKYRQVLLLYYFLGLDSTEIAQALHVKSSGMKMFLTRARRNFRTQYSAVRKEDEA